MSAKVEAGRLVASLPMRTYRNVGEYLLVVVGLGPDGGRDILLGPERAEGYFVGTVLEWLRAPDLAAATG